MTDITRDAIASLLKDTGKRDALAQLLVEVVQPNHLPTDIMNLILDTRRLNLGDAIVKKIRKGIKVRTLVPGSIHMASEITVTDRINWVFDGLDVKVMFNKWELDKGDIGTIDEIKREMLAKLSDAFMNRVLTALSTVWSTINTPDNYTTVATAVNATVLKAAIDEINQHGGVKAVVGTRAALTPITTFGAGFVYDGTNIAASQTYLDEIMRTGFLGTYYGAKIVALDQVYDNPEDYNALLPNDIILVIGNKAGEFVTYGDPVWKVWDDMRPTPPYTYIEAYQRFGLIIDKAQAIYVIKVT